MDDLHAVLPYKFEPLARLELNRVEQAQIETPADNRLENTNMYCVRNHAVSLYGNTPQSLFTFGTAVYHLELLLFVS